MFVKAARRTLLWGTALTALAIAPGAQATVGHRSSSQFGNGQFAGPSGVAIDQSTGDVFVADLYGFTVNAFTVAGDLVRQWDGTATPAGYLGYPAQLATDGSTVYVDDTANSAVLRFDTDGTYLGALDGSLTTATNFASPSGVAVDPVNGDVYVANTGNNVVDRFDAAGAFLDELGSGELASPTQLAVDSAQALYVLDSGNGRVVKYNGGTLGATVDANAPTAIAVDPSDDHLYVADTGAAGSQVSDFASDGTLRSSFGSGHIVAAAGLAVNASTGRVYLSDQGAAVIQTFNQITVPTVTTTAGATAITATGATVAGTVNPESVAGTTYHVEYGTDTSYGSATPETSAGGGSAAVPAGASLTDLAPATTYHFRVVAKNALGANAGPDRTFTTAPGQVAIDGGPGSAAATPTTATLHGTLNPNGAATSYHFEYGASTSYGSATPTASAGSTPGSTPVSAAMTGLQPGSTYHFRLVADNGIGGAVNGTDATFTTAPGAPVSASEVTSRTATLHGTVDMPAQHHFEYGTDASYGASTPERNDGATSPGRPVSAGVAQLTPGITYHFRLVAIKPDGQMLSSDDATFTTPPLAAVTTNAVAGVTPTAATLAASVDTHGLAGTVAFTITTGDQAFALTTPGAPLAATSGTQGVAVPVADLPPGLSYVVRASATVAGTTVWGDPVAFSTPQRPPFAPSAPPPPVSGAPYGCQAPHLDAVDGHPQAGDTVTVTGGDLGVGGSVALGDAPVKGIAWTATGFRFVVPDGATGTLPLTVNCGAASNTVAVAVRTTPSNAFTIAKTSVKGAVATLSIKVPGPGKVQTSGARTTAVSRTVAKASTATVTVRLSTAGRRALAKAKSRTLKVAVRVTYTSAGGTSKTTTKTITFTRKASR